MDIEYLILLFSVSTFEEAFFSSSCVVFVLFCFLFKVCTY